MSNTVMVKEHLSHLQLLQPQSLYVLGTVMTHAPLNPTKKSTTGVGCGCADSPEPDTDGDDAWNPKKWAGSAVVKLRLRW